MSGEIRVERDALTATVVIDNPTKRNAMDQAMWIAMAETVEALSGEAALRCIVLRGAGEEAFGSGADIAEFARIRATKEQAVAFARHGHRAMHAVRACPIPTVAAIRGACVGGGLELAVNCDIRIAADDAKFGVPIARLGAVLAYPELEGLVRVAGFDAALRLLLEGNIVDAPEALSMGLVSRVVTVAAFDSEVAATVGRIAAGAPLSARWHKRFIARLREGTALTDAELAEGYACYDTQDYHTGFSAFLAKTKPVFEGK